MSSIYDAIQSANQFESLTKEISSKLAEVNDKLKSAQYPIGSVCDPNYFDDMINTIHRYIQSLQSLIDNSTSVFEKTLQTKVRESDELVSQFNTLLTSLDLARESALSKTPYDHLYTVPYTTELPYCTYISGRVLCI